MCSMNPPRACIQQTPKPLLMAFERLRAAGNSLFVVEHDLDVIRHADWIVDVGPAPENTAATSSTAVPATVWSRLEPSQTRRYLFGRQTSPADAAHPAGWLQLKALHAIISTT